MPGRETTRLLSSYQVRQVKSAEVLQVGLKQSIRLVIRRPVELLLKRLLKKTGSFKRETGKETLITSVHAALNQEYLRVTERSMLARLLDYLFISF